MVILSRLISVKGLISSVASGNAAAVGGSMRRYLPSVKTTLTRSRGKPVNLTLFFRQAQSAQATTDDLFARRCCSSTDDEDSGQTAVEVKALL